MLLLPPGRHAAVATAAAAIDAEQRPPPAAALLRQAHAQCVGLLQPLLLAAGCEAAARGGAAAPPEPGACAALLAQLDGIGWARVAALARDLSGLTLALTDAAGRAHAVELRLPPSFPVAAPAVAVALPRPWRPRWLPGYTLAQLVAQAEQVLESYQALWAELEDLDAHTQLLDPPQALAAPYAAPARTLALGNGCSAAVSLQPDAPRALPAAVFHGPSAAVAGLQAAWYGRAAAAWSPDRSVRANLEAVLELRLPPPRPGVRKGCAALAAPPGDSQGDGQGGSPADAASDSDDEEGEPGACAICYALHLPSADRPGELGEAPSVSCPGAACGRAFHGRCLAEWLGALPTSRRVFDTLFGSCPFCGGALGVSVRGTG
ncbi:Fancl [Scenedesmus sp. PABB004]|nr:Fancl [Scenedesmus sp. PABB004]